MSGHIFWLDVPDFKLSNYVEVTFWQIEKHARKKGRGVFRTQKNI